MPDEVVEGEIVSDEETSLTLLDPSTAMEALNKSEVDMQITTAHRFPRSLDKVLKEAETLACMDEETAESMMYAVPRSGKTIKGPTVRLAEIMASSWGNLRTATQVVSMDGDFVTARGMAFDLEKNFAQAMEVKRRITDSKGKRFKDDMIQTTANAASSIAFREAVFKIIPRVYVNRIYRKAVAVAVGDAKTLVERRDKMLGHFQKMGVPPDRVLAAVGAASVDEIDLEKLATIKGIAQAIKDGETSIDSAFPAPGAKHADPGDKAKNATERFRGAGVTKETNTDAQSPQPADSAPVGAKSPSEQKEPESPATDLSDLSRFIDLISKQSPDNMRLPQIKSALKAWSSNLPGQPKLEATTHEQRVLLLEAATNQKFDFSLGVVRT